MYVNTNYSSISLDTLIMAYLAGKIPRDYGQTFYVKTYDDRPANLWVTYDELLVYGRLYTNALQELNTFI